MIQIASRRRPQIVGPLCQMAAQPGLGMRRRLKLFASETRP